MTSVNLHLSGKRSALPLVLLAPFPLDAEVWEEVRTRLDVFTITVDPPGFGGAGAGGEPSLEAYATALLTALDAEGVGRFVVAGNSMGGYAAMVLADLHPERLSGIGLLGTKATADNRQARATRLTMAKKAVAGTPVAALVAPMARTLISATTKEDSPGAVDRLRSWLIDAPAEGIAWAQRAMAARTDRTEALRRLDVPALVLHGTDDPLMGPETQIPMADALGVQVSTVADRGHLLPLEAPDQVTVALTALWARARVGG